MNPYLEVLEKAEVRKATHHERAGALARLHFERHPECRKEIVSMNAQGVVTRGEREINLTQRYFAGWFDAIQPKKRKPARHVWVLPVNEDGGVRQVDILPMVREWSKECQREAARMRAEAQMKQKPLFMLPPASHSVGMGVQ